MALSGYDDKELFIVDDLFPVSVYEMDTANRFYTILKKYAVSKEIAAFLESIGFSFDDYGITFNSKILSSNIRLLFKRYGYKVERFQIELPLSGEKYYVYIPYERVYSDAFHYISFRYLDKWKKIKTALEEEYGILKPYDMSTVEHEDNKLITSSDGTQTHAYTDTDNVTKDDENSEDRIYGFNSTEDGGVKSDSSMTKHQMTSNGSDSGTKTNKLDYNSDRDIDRTVTRKGNTGNITSQEMIERELKLREYLISQVIYKDLNEYLTLMVY